MICRTGGRSRSRFSIPTSHRTPGSRRGAMKGRQRLHCRPLCARRQQGVAVMASMCRRASALSRRGARWQLSISAVEGVCLPDSIRSRGVDGGIMFLCCTARQTSLDARRYCMGLQQADGAALARCGSRAGCCCCRPRHGAAGVDRRRKKRV